MTTLSRPTVRWTTTLLLIVLACVAFGLAPLYGAAIPAMFGAGFPPT